MGAATAVHACSIGRGLPCTPTSLALAFLGAMLPYLVDAPYGEVGIEGIKQICRPRDLPHKAPSAYDWHLAQSGILHS